MVVTLKEMGYSKIPRHLQEAVEGYNNLTRLFPDLGGLSLDPETELRFNQYGSVYIQLMFYRPVVLILVHYL
jgi:hypothetical protein